MAQRNPKNTRRYRRATIRVLVDYQVQGEIHCDYATTLGAGGMFLRTDLVMARGDCVKVRFRVPNGESLHEFEARADDDSDAAPVSVDIPSGAIASGEVAAVNVVVVAPVDVPPPPPAATEGSSSDTFTFGSTIIEIRWYDSTGSALDTFKVNRPAEICVPFTKADVDAASGGPDGLALWRHNGTEWVQLNSTVNISAGTVCARTFDFSFFALGLAVAAPDADEAALPVTGDYSPGMGSLILAMLAGIALVATGVFTARRARRVRPTSL